MEIENRCLDWAAQGDSPFEGSVEVACTTSSGSCFQSMTMRGKKEFFLTDQSL